MTNYDPFSYGEVRLDADQQPGVTAQEAEDLLFADAGPDEQAAQPSATWERTEPVAPAVEGSGPGLAASMDFGAEVLGEDGGASRPPAAVYGGKPAPRSAPAESSAEISAEMSAEISAGASAGTYVEAAGLRASRGVRVAPRSTTLAKVLPVTFLVLGGAASVGIWKLQLNPVLAMITGAATLVGALFARLLLRG